MSPLYLLCLVRAVGSASSTRPPVLAHIWGRSAPTGSTEKSCSMHHGSCSVIISPIGQGSTRKPHLTSYKTSQARTTSNFGPV